MKVVEINYGGNKIEFYNSIIGMEEIKLNGEIVSKQFSFLGAEHQFDITEKELKKKCKFKIVPGATYGIGFDFYVEDKKIVTSTKSGGIGSLYRIFIILAVILLIKYGTPFFYTVGRMLGKYISNG